MDKILALPVEQNLTKAKSLIRNGQSLEALELYNAILRKFPNNKRAQFGIQQLKPSEQTINQLMQFYNSGRYEDAEILGLNTIKIFLFLYFII